MKDRTMYPAAMDAEMLQARLARRVVARLDETIDHVPRDIEERLRFARERALEHARAARTATPVVSTRSGGGSATLALAGTGGTPWWLRLASMLPIVVLFAGLMAIQQRHWEARVQAAAEIDVAILADTVPPDAYSDPGFAEFLKNPTVTN